MNMPNRFNAVKFFEGEDGKMWKRSVKDLGGEILLVSQFTLYYRYKGTNLDFSKAMPPEPAQDFYNVRSHASCFQSALNQNIPKIFSPHIPGPTTSTLQKSRRVRAPWV